MKIKDKNKSTLLHINRVITYKSSDEDKLLQSKEGEIFEYIYKKRLDKIEELISKIDDNDLKFTTLRTREKFDFTEKNDPLTLLKKIRDGKITLERAKDLQEDFSNNIKKIRKGNKT